MDECKALGAAKHHPILLEMLSEELGCEAADIMVRRCRLTLPNPC